MLLRKGDAVPGVVRPPVPHFPPVREAFLAVHWLDHLLLGARVEVELGAGPQHCRPDGVIPRLQDRMEERIFGRQPGDFVRYIVC